MSCRRYGTRPTLAFWMLVALADVALIVASAGLATLLVLAVVAVLAVVGWRVARRAAASRQAVVGGVPAAGLQGTSPGLIGPGADLP